LNFAGSFSGKIIGHECTCCPDDFADDLDAAGGAVAQLSDARDSAVTQRQAEPRGACTADGRQQADLSGVWQLEPSVCNPKDLGTWSQD
jgi:hypothetical protein